jgi:hypothetical protein
LRAATKSRCEDERRRTEVLIARDQIGASFEQFLRLRHFRVALGEMRFNRRHRADI